MGKITSVCMYIFIIIIIIIIIQTLGRSGQRPESSVKATGMGQYPAS